MRSNSALIRLAFLFALIFMLFVAAFLAQAQENPVAETAKTQKLSVRQKALLPDYKGPSRFMGRKALVTFSPTGDWSR